MPRVTFEGPLSIEPLPRVMSMPAGLRLAGRFAALELLGRGGMAEVYKVRDENTGKELAFKRLLRDSGMSDALARTLFEREYHTLAQLTHPCIIQIYDYGVDEQGPYYTMELLDGMDLRKHGRLPWQQAARVLSDVASALAMLHSRRWLHRDLSPRNVVLTKSGVAKLIDFGAMIPMGVARTVVGTAPFVAPEALQQQALDSRADLFALGALAYRILTGRHAFPARSFHELRDRWRSAPRPPDKLVELPPAFNSLILELLSLDRSARPATAADVIDRLGLLAGPQPPRQELGAAWLANPKLCGRERELGVARKQLVRSMRGQGSGLLIEGEPGVGRSRFLDACVLESKLLGPTVLRADASDGARGDYGVAAALGTQLLHALPDQCQEAARLRRPLLATVIKGLASPLAAPLPVGAARPERRHLQAALRDFFRAVSRRKRIIIAVDDLDRCDEPSAALLASLVHRSERRKLIVIATVSSTAASNGPIELLRRMAPRIPLSALDRAETEAMLQSLFGNANHLASVAQRVYDVSRGNPRLVMELAQHLLSTGRARYAGGSWSLPQQLMPDDLPASFEAALLKRVDALTPDAVELLKLFSLADPLLLSLQDYPRLHGNVDRARTFRALDELVQADILQPEGERYRFLHQPFRELLAQRLSPRERQQLHARLALLFEHGGDPIELTHHLMHSGQESRAISLLLAQRVQGGFAPNKRLLDLLDHAVSVSERLELSERQRLALRIWLVSLSGALCALDVFSRQAPRVVEALAAASGLNELQAFGESPSAEQVKETLARISAACDARPERERPFAPADAIRELAGVCATFCGVAWITLDPRFLQVLPSLSPFASISPAASLMQLTVDGAKRTHVGAEHHAWQNCCEVLERLDRDRAAFDKAIHTRIRRGILYALAAFEAVSGRATALARIEELLDVPGYRGNAWRVRRVYHQMHGEEEDAARCQRRGDLLSLQDGTQELFPGTALLRQLAACWTCDDLGGLKQLLEEIERMATQLPGWNVALKLARAHYLRVKGDLDAAHRLSSELIDEAPPGSHILCVAVAALHVTLLHLRGQHQAARDHGLTQMQRFNALSFVTTDYTELSCATAEALAACGEHLPAIDLCATAIADLEQANIGGVRLGAACESRAHVAIAMLDPGDFERWSSRVETLYTRHESPTLCAKYGRLLQHARSAGLNADDHSGIGAFMPATSAEEDHTDHSRMSECIDARERATCALTLILEHGDSVGGHLYAMRGGELCHIAAVPEQSPPDDLSRLVERVIAAELSACDATSSSAITDAGLVDLAPRGETLLGSTYKPIVLTTQRGGQTIIAAVAAVERKPGGSKLAPHLLSSLAAILLDHCDVDPLIATD